MVVFGLWLFGVGLWGYCLGVEKVVFRFVFGEDVVVEVWGGLVSVVSLVGN